jgi:hypothetical protein
VAVTAGAEEEGVDENETQEGEGVGGDGKSSTDVVV